MDRHEFDEPRVGRDLFRELVEHLEGLPRHRLESVAEHFSVEAADAEALARQWCQHPDDVLAFFDEQWSQRTWDRFLELAYEHDVELETDWLEAGVRRQLSQAGVLQSSPLRPDTVGTTVVPGLIAAIVAPRFDSVRPSLPILLGRMEEAELSELAGAYGLSEQGSRVELVLRLEGMLTDPSVAETILERLPTPDWLGPALMTLELGGICYWQEIFGFDVEEKDEPEGREDQPETAEVVPLMGDADRNEERQIAECLMDLGILFRFYDPETPWAQVAVPEELWGPLWAVGRGWLIKWVEGAYRDLQSQSVGGRPEEGVTPDLQSVGKWLACESQSGRVVVEDGEPVDETADRLESVTSAGPIDWSTYLDVLFELKVLRRDHQGWVLPGMECKTLLDMPRREFQRNVLYEWCSGFAGKRADRHLAEAIGLDDSWRTQASEILRARHEFIPVWMQWEGLEPAQTGAGCLRDEHDHAPEQLATELGLVNGYVWGTKLLWLDLLSMLEADGRWYPRAFLRELMQLSASVCLFSQVGVLLEDPHAWHYLPVQRSSFLSGPVHTDHFDHWLDDIVGELMEPLDVAQLDDEEGLVWLEPAGLRIESPPGWPEAQRLQLLEAILGPQEAEGFDPTPGTRRDLRAVDAGVPDDSDVLSLDTPMQDLMARARDRDIAEFDGTNLRFDGRGREESS